jgi:nicotinate-nucleotide adenylyltransferase
VSDLEVRRGGISYTIDTIRTLKEAHPRVNFRLIVGSDSLAEIDTWRDPQEILDRVRLIIFRRPASEAGTSIAGFDDRIDYADAPLFDVSATVIRGRVRAHKSIRYMVPESVRSYILEHGLYTSAESASTVT